MDLLVLSDLHFEFHRDGGASFVSHLPTEVDVCVLAGDIAVGAGIPAALELFCHQYKDVVYVHGNHEFYGSSLKEVHDLTLRAAEDHDNLHWLNHSSVELHGRRFMGTPLWFRNNPKAPKHGLNDFFQIHRLEEWVYEENQKATRFLQEVQPGDIVVTHHLPSARSIADRYKGSPLNAFFLCDVEGILQATQPRLWIHGHTHDSMDYKIGETRVVCNPFGYAGHDENWDFDDCFVVEDL